MLICPKCKQKLNIENELFIQNKSYKCNNNHCYDISKEGYTNFLDSKTGSGDNSILINARENFLNKGYYNKLRESICNLIKKYQINSLIDCGCGTGYYTEEFSNYAHTLYGLDISKDAIKIASKRHNKNKNITYFVSSCKEIPIKTNTFDAIINIFAPYFDNEFNRILNDNKYLIIASCNTDHLYELKKEVYTNPYHNENVSKEIFRLDSFNLLEEQDLTYKIFINNNDDLLNLFMMTPYYYKTKEDDFNKLKTIKNLDITISFKISVFIKK